MGTYQPVFGVNFDVGPDKGSAEKRVVRGVKVTSQATTSPLYQEGEIKSGVDAVVAGTNSLKQGMDTCAGAAIALKKARTELNVLMRAWDKSYDLLVAASEKHCQSAEDGTSLGLAVRSKKSHVFEKPLSISLKYDSTKTVLRIHVKRAPGTHSLCVQVSNDAADPASWKELAGDGVIHQIQNPSPGTWHVRAQSRSAKARSEFTEPFSVLVK